MAKSSLEKQLEKNRQEIRKQAEKARKDDQKRLKQEKLLAYKEDLRQRAASIINGQEIINGLRILDINAEIVLNCLIEHCDDQDSGHVDFDCSIFPEPFQDSIDLELEKLIQYGMLTVFTRWMGGGIVNLLPAAFAYKKSKEEAMLKKSQSDFPTVEHHYYGNTNVINAPVNSSTIIAGNGNSVSSEQKEIDSSESSEEKHIDICIKNTIFISHRSTDEAIVDLLMDFFARTGIPVEAVFCSSRPGNDVKVKISDEVKSAINSSKINIAILSKEYYESVYCLNEAGILWFLDSIPVIPIRLPEITFDKMIGFLNDDYKTRSLDDEEDIAYIYDTIADKLGISKSKVIIIQDEIQKLKEKYESFISQR